MSDLRSYRILGYRDTDGYCESIAPDTELWEIEELSPKTRESIPFAFSDDETEIVPHPLFVIEEIREDGSTTEFDFENHYWDRDTGPQRYITVEDLSELDRLLQGGKWESFIHALDDAQGRMD